jgi:DNA-binding CsgD family transcriptional regulator
LRQSLYDLNEGELAPIENLAEHDPARDFIAEILSIVPVSKCSFARFRNNRAPDQLLLSEGTDARREELDRLREEFGLQRERTTKGPRLAATLTTLREPYVSGVTLIFADKRREFGVLSLQRTAELGSFSTVEIQALALALDSSTDRLSGFTVAEASLDGAASLDAFDQPIMHVLDRDLKVVLTWDAQGGRNVPTASLHARVAQRLPAIIEDAVRDLVVTRTSDPATHVIGVAHPVPFLTVRTQPLCGPAGQFVGVILERPPGGQVFNKAARAFNVSPRELEVLAMLLQGATLGEVAKAMHITSSTVQDHISSMLEKTGSRNRSELIAKVLSPRTIMTRPAMPPVAWRDRGDHRVCHLSASTS